MAHPPRIPNWLPLNAETIYFVTFCVEGKEWVGGNERAFVAFQNAIGRLDKWSVLTALLMPDHVHLLAAPVDRDLPVGNLAAAVKRWMRAELNARWRWQPGSFDRLLRSTESASEKWLYIQENPVRAGFVQCREDWP
jgi:REP element-mobilizing transposase RayT